MIVCKKMSFFFNATILNPGLHPLIDIDERKVSNQMQHLSLNYFCTLKSAGIMPIKRKVVNKSFNLSSSCNKVAIFVEILVVVGTNVIQELERLSNVLKNIILKK